MGLFGGIKSNWKKSEAAAIIQNLLEISQKMGIFDYDPAKIANSLVAEVWEARPDVFDGKFGQRPHKLSIAAIALTCGIRTAKESEYQRGLFIALGRILGEVSLNGSLYPFNSIDESFLQGASELFNQKTSEYGLGAA